MKFLATDVKKPLAAVSAILDEGNRVVFDNDGEGRDIGLFATTYVAPEVRRAGVAIRLLATGEQWMLDQGLSVAATYTEENNTRLQNLYLGRGYSMTEMPKRFVKLAKPLP